MRILRLVFLIHSMLVLSKAYTNDKPLLKFIENKNQWSEEVLYRAQVNGGFLSLHAKGFDFHFYDYQKINADHLQREATAFSEAGLTNLEAPCIEGWHASLSFVGTSPTSPVPSGKSSEYYNYFLGSDQSRWAAKVYAFESVLYPDFYSGIDLRVYSQGPNAKYDWIVKAGEDPSRIRWQYKGYDSMSLIHGSVHVFTPLADIIERKPYAYQQKGEYRFEVPVQFALYEGILQYVFPEGYDPCYDLIIDPLLIFSTYSGATADNWGSSATPGERGRLYSTGVVRDVYGINGGQTASGKLSKTEGAFQSTNAGGYDMAIFKYDSSGRVLLYASYLGGDQTDSPHSLLMNHDEELLILGTTSSNDFPTSSNAFSKVFKGGELVQPSTVPYLNGSDIVVTKLSADGTSLLASTYLGGSGNDGLSLRTGPLVRNYGDEQRGDMIVDESNNVYICTVTTSTNFPMLNGLGKAYGGGITDALVMKLNADLSNLLWSSFIGGDAADAAYSIKLDSDNNLLIAGGTNSLNFPTTENAYQKVSGGNVDGWVVKMSNAGDSIIQATYTGTSSYDQTYFLDLDSNDEVYLFGQTTGNFPVTSGVFSRANSGQFVQKLSKDLSSLRFSTVFGSGTPIPNISPTAFLVNDCNNLYLAGWGGNINRNQGFWQSGTNNMPITPDALQSTTQGSDFYFMVLTADASELLYGTYLGGNQSSIHVDGGTSRFDKSGVVYHAVCAGCGGGFDDFRTTAGAWSRLNNSQNCNNAAFKFDLSSLTARLQTNNEARTQPGFSNVCIPDGIRFQNLSTGGEIFEWDLGNGEKRVRTDTASFVYFYNTPGNYTVTLTAIDQGTCKVRDVVSKNIRVNIAQSKAQEDDIICEGDNYQLKANGAVSYQWLSADRRQAFSVQSPGIRPEKKTTYYVTMREASGCIRRDTVIIDVVPAIVPEFDLVREANCLDRPTIKLDNPKADSSDYIFTFDFGDGQQSDLPEVKHSFTADSLYRIRLIAQREFCVFEQEQLVDIRSVWMPNVITPLAQDGKNDAFVVWYGKKGQSPADQGLRTNLIIYNRWGNVVYENTDYQNDWTGGDLPNGVYFYEVTIDGYATCKDWLHLIK